MPSSADQILALGVKQPYLDGEAAKSLQHRLSRIGGPARSLRERVADRRCADEILLRVAAVKAALNQVSSQILDHELTACMDSCTKGNAGDRLKKATKVLSTLLKQSGPSLRLGQPNPRQIRGRPIPSGKIRGDRPRSGSRFPSAGPGPVW